MARTNGSIDRGYSNTATAIHKRIKTRRGRSSEHACVDCSGQACNWSWVHNTDPTNVNNYEPRCRSCHAKYDKFGFAPGHRRTPRGKANKRWVNTPKVDGKFVKKDDPRLFGKGGMYDADN